MKNKVVQKILVASAITGSMLLASGCSIIDDFNPKDNTPMLDYGTIEIQTVDNGSENG